MSFDLAKKIADAVLYEGYMLYPYRPSSAKNRYRWQFGIVAPRAWTEAGGDPSEMQTECLIEAHGEASVEVIVRFLQVMPDAGDSWDDAVERTVEIPSFPLEESSREHPIELPDSPLRGRIRINAKRAGDLTKLRINIQNLTEFPDAGTADRQTAMRLSMAGVHTMISMRGGAFISLTDPPLAAAKTASECANIHTWPVLIGSSEARNMILSSPIILPDYPAVAPESQGNFFDATEIDELLTLRVMTLTDDEKREARAADSRARDIIDRCDTIPPEMFERLHGAIRSPGVPNSEQFFNPVDYEPETASVEVGGCRVSKGARVRLNPRRNADVMDMFLAGRIARVESVERDIEDRVYVAVTVEDDPGADMHRSFGRFFYFYPEELQALQKET